MIHGSYLIEAVERPKLRLKGTSDDANVSTIVIFIRCN